jgi:hypothetical protein
MTAHDGDDSVSILIHRIREITMAAGCAHWDECTGMAIIPDTSVVRRSLMHSRFGLTLGAARLLVGFAVASCSDPTPSSNSLGSWTLGGVPLGDASTAPATSGTSSSGSSSGGAPGSNSSSGANSEGTDSAVVGDDSGGVGPPPIDASDVFEAGVFSDEGGTSNVFAQQPPYVATTGTGGHNAGRDCNQCHGFGMAGTIYDGRGNPVGGAEIRLVDNAGNAFSVYSGANGNFSGGGGFLAPAHVGARNSTTATLMISPLTYGGCNKCHCTAGANCTTTRLHLP